MNSHRVLALSASMLFAHAAFGSCEHRASRSGEVDAAGARKVVVEAAAGDLIVAGKAGMKFVHASGEACAEDMQTLEAIQLEVRRDGDEVHVRAVMPEQRSFRRRATLDLKIELPADAVLELQDSSGDLKVLHVAAARIDDSSGDQSIREIAGDVKVQDSSGDVEIEGVRGSVELRDSSGEVKIKDVAGNVSIPVDSSGSLTVRHVRGDVHIATDSSGDIVIADVNQNIRIDNDSSGDIRVADVGGAFTVASDTTGDISHRNVLGKITIPDDDD